jgi:hypothetical protein
MSMDVNEDGHGLAEGGAALYMYLDESGNLGFSDNGTPYFIMTCAVALRPFALADKARSLWFDLLEKGRDATKFHACEDDNETRVALFNLISENPGAYHVYAAVVDKRLLAKAMRSPEKVYAMVFEDLIDEIYHSERVVWCDRAIVITDKLPKDAVKKNVTKPLKHYMKEKFQTRHIPYALYHLDSIGDMGLQLTDYFCWAVQRNLTQGKEWPMNKVRDSVVKISTVVP